MNNLSHYSNFLFEADKKEKMIPFLMRIDTADDGCFNYWHVGVFPTFREFSDYILDEYGIYFDDDRIIEDADELISVLGTKRLNGGRVTRGSIFWSDGLELTSDYDDHRYSNSIEASNPFKLVELLKMKFKNVGKIINENLLGNPESTNYLVESLKNKASDFIEYDKDKLKKIIDLSGWDDKKIKAFLTVNKIKGMY